MPPLLLLALKPAHLSAFEMIAAGRRHFANEISVYLVIHPLCFHSILFYPHPLFSVSKPLKIIGVWKSHFFKSLSDFANLLTELYTHVKMQRNNRRLVFCNLTKCCNFSAHVSTCYTPPCSSHLGEKKTKTGNNREWRYIISHYHLLFLHLLFRTCLIVSTETANCCFLFDLPANAEVLSGPIWSCSPPLFLLFS